MDAGFFLAFEILLGIVVGVFLGVFGTLAGWSDIKVLIGWGTETIGIH